MNLLKTKHPIPYKVSWLENGHQLLVSEQCEIELQISYKDKVLCDVMPMDACHILLGRPWQHDRSAKNDGINNVYKLEKDGIKHKLIPLQEKEEGGSSTILLLGGEEFLQKLSNEEVSYVIVWKPSGNIEKDLSNLPREIQYMLSEFWNIIVDDLPSELPHIRKISHHMDFIPRMSFPNKASYKVTPQENEEIRKHAQ